MTETLLRNFESGTSSQQSNWIDKVSILINEIQTIMQIEAMVAKESSRGTAEDD